MAAVTTDFFVSFWDTSAILPLVHKEAHTPSAKAAAGQPGPKLAWEWLRVEARLAVARRGDEPDRVGRLLAWYEEADWQAFGQESLEEVMVLGVRHRLRAADAGHLYALLQSHLVFPDIVFVCFDGDLAAAAKREGVKLWGE